MTRLSTRVNRLDEALQPARCDACPFEPGPDGRCVAFINETGIGRIDPPPPLPDNCANLTVVKFRLINPDEIEREVSHG